MKKFVIIIKSHRSWLFLAVILCSLLFLWANVGLDSISFDSDLARDLHQISNIQRGEVVWLGPWLGPGLHASSAYYYLFYPAIELFGGKVAGMLWFNLFLGLLAVSYFGYHAVKKYRYAGVASTALIGLTPLISDNILHAGNGFTYIYFTLICFTALWFKAPLGIASLAAGFAVALHPAAGILPIFLLIGWWYQGHKWKDALLGVLAFLVPLLPLIAFEVITKGYVVRSFLGKQTDSNIYATFSLHNAQQIAGLLGLALWQLGVLLGITGYLAAQSKSKNFKMWVATTLAILFLILFVPNMIWRYLFAITVLVIFTIVITFMQHKATAIVLGLVALMLFARSPLIRPTPKANRTIIEIETVADFIAQSNVLDANKNIAVVAAQTSNAEVPQADDYRFLLRNRGFTVMEVTEHAQAEQLLYVIEVPDFDWEDWSTWEIESFGEKELNAVEKYNDDVTVVVYDKVE